MIEGCEVHIKRDDLSGMQLSGNKVHKWLPLLVNVIPRLIALMVRQSSQSCLACTLATAGPKQMGEGAWLCHVSQEHESVPAQQANHSGSTGPLLQDASLLISDII